MCNSTSFLNLSYWLPEQEIIRIFLIHKNIWADTVASLEIHILLMYQKAYILLLSICIFNKCMFSREPSTALSSWVVLLPRHAAQCAGKMKV